MDNDLRRHFYNYASPSDDQRLVDPRTGYAHYEVTEIDGVLPHDLQGTMYRNGPGQFGQNGHRVSHFLDADGLVLSVHIPPPSSNNNKTNQKKDDRKVTFTSRFVETSAFKAERKAQRSLFRGTFGSGPRGKQRGPGVNQDPTEPSLWEKIKHRAFDTTIKNTANAHVIAFGGKLLALFEAVHPHRLDPKTLETIGIDDMPAPALPTTRPLKQC